MPQLLGYYDINLEQKNNNFLNAIIKLNKHAVIHYIRTDKNQKIVLWNDGERDLKRIGEYLPEFIKTHPTTQKIRVGYLYKDSYALFYAFPRINNSEVECDMDDMSGDLEGSPLSKNEEQPQRHPHDESKLARDLLIKDRLIHLKTKREKRIEIRNFEPILFKILTREDARSALREVQCSNEVGISGAVDLTSIKTIVFHCRGRCYAVNYGEKPNFHEMRGYPTFDIDDGFILHNQPSASVTLEEKLTIEAGVQGGLWWEPLKDEKKTTAQNEIIDLEKLKAYLLKEDQLILKELQKHFSVWRDKNYKGKIFPNMMSLDAQQESSLLARLFSSLRAPTKPPLAEETGPKDIDQALHKAIESKNLKKAKKLLDSGANPDSTLGMGGYTPLEKAINENQLGMVRLLLEHEATVNYDKDNASSALFMAVKQGNIQMVRLLLEHGANINGHINRHNCFDDPATMLDEALLNKNDDIARLLMENGADRCKVENKKRARKIHKEIAEQKEVVKLARSIIFFSENTHKSDPENGRSPSPSTI